jgi:hypothetical protein
MFPGQIAAVTPNKPAIIMASTSQVITYKRLLIVSANCSFNMVCVQVITSQYALKIIPDISKSSGVATMQDSFTPRAQAASHLMN